MPVLIGLLIMNTVFGWWRQVPDIRTFLVTLAFISGVLLGFNLLQVYPLNGGQILRSLLWFWVGHARSLMAASGW
ncbi:MAG TPA: hypothetical protein VNM47_09825 [Terriglobia bacterium]|nr:hypothetical protein [Terriglobia bacterium]